MHNSIDNIALHSLCIVCFQKIIPIYFYILSIYLTELSHNTEGFPFQETVVELYNCGVVELREKIMQVLRYFFC